MADKNAAQQGYITSEPYAIQKAGVKAKVLLFADNGYPAYATTVSCMDKTVKERNKAVAAFVRGSAEGWKSYMNDPAPGNALIKKDNPNMTDDQLAYSVAKLKEYAIVNGGDAAKLGIGVDDRAAPEGELRLPGRLEADRSLQGRADQDLHDRVREGPEGAALSR